MSIEGTLNNLKSQGKFKNYIFLKDPQPFNTFFKDKDFDVVQLISIESNNSIDILGFVGAFSWRNNTLEPLDGDSYEPDILLYGYEEFTNPDKGIERGLDILVSSW